jgi:hypothetical protein
MVAASRRDSGIKPGEKIRVSATQKADSKISSFKYRFRPETDKLKRLLVSIFRANG